VGLFRACQHFTAPIRRPDTGPKSPRLRAVPSVPVTVAPVHESVFSVYLAGLDRSVLQHRSRSHPGHGQIERSPSRGATVNQGDLRSQSDPRPLPGSARSAKANKAHDEANLANATPRSARFTSWRFAPAQPTPSRSTVAQLTAHSRPRRRHLQRANHIRLPDFGADSRASPAFARSTVGNIVNASTQTGNCDHRPESADCVVFHRAGRPAALHHEVGAIAVHRLV